MKSKLVIVIATIALILVILLYPIETTVVPEWRLRIVDEQGMPYVGLRVVEDWKHYSLELGEGTNGDERWTDRDGAVQFPKRSIRLSILSRLARTSITSLKRYLHGSTGIHAYVMATGPQGTNDLKYDPNKSPPDTWAVPRHEKQNKDR